MSRRSRTDAYMRIWMNFSDVQTETQLVAFEEKLKAFIREQGYSVYGVEFRVKDNSVRPRPQGDKG